MTNQENEIGAELDEMLGQLEEKTGLPKLLKPRMPSPEIKSGPTKRENKRFSKTKKANKVARKSRRVNRGKRGGKKR